MTSHQPVDDDGVTYCGWDGHEGCGELWPCSAVRLGQASRDHAGEAAVFVMARQLIADLVAAHASTEWGNYPEIGEYGWQNVVAKARELAQPCSPHLRDKAYAVLARLAESGAG